MVLGSLVELQVDFVGQPPLDGLEAMGLRPFGLVVLRQKLS